MQATDAFAEMKIPLVRVDVDKEKDMAAEYGVVNLPMILSFSKCKNKGMYKGVHSPEALEMLNPFPYLTVDCLPASAVICPCAGPAVLQVWVLSCAPVLTSRFGRKLQASAVQELSSVEDVCCGPPLLPRFSLPLLTSFSQSFLIVELFSLSAMPIYFPRSHPSIVSLHRSSLSQ